MTRAVLALGSNMGDPLALLRGAYQQLRPHVIAASPIVRTPPVSPVPQADYLNAVLIVADPAADAYEWLARARKLETTAGRVRDMRWGPRTLDVDIIAAFDDAGGPIRVADADYTVPHPRAHERAFVLVPWLAADSAAELPGHGRVADLIAQLPGADKATVVTLNETWEA